MHLIKQHSNRTTIRRTATRIIMPKGEDEKMAMEHLIFAAFSWTSIDSCILTGSPIISIVEKLSAILLLRKWSFMHFVRTGSFGYFTFKYPWIAAYIAPSVKSFAGNCWDRDATDKTNNTVCHLLWDGRNGCEPWKILFDSILILLHFGKT